MGATKRLAEMTVVDAANDMGRDFVLYVLVMCLAAAAAWFPCFKRQIARGGPVTITHPDMKRYFMTIPEAVYLVLQAASMGEGGETYVLNMGEQVRILDLAEDLIRLSGLEPGGISKLCLPVFVPAKKSVKTYGTAEVHLPAHLTRIFINWTAMKICGARS